MMLLARNCGLVFGLLCCGSLTLGCDEGTGGGPAGGAGAQGVGGAGSGGQGGNDQTNETAGAPSGEYLMVSSEGFTAVEGTTIGISFVDGQLSFLAGCNNHQAEYSIEDDVLKVEGFGSTTKACDTALMDQDSWLADFLSSEPTVAVEGDTVTLVGDDATLVLQDREVAHPDAPLVGTNWTIDTLVDGEVATGGFSTTASLVFTEDSTFTLEGPCNTAQGTFEPPLQEVGEGEITFGTVAFTEKACSDTEAADFEAHLQEVFRQGSATYEIDANRLHIDHGTTGIAAQAAE